MWWQIGPYGCGSPGVKPLEAPFVQPLESPWLAPPPEGPCLQVFDEQPFPIIREDIKLGWLIAKEMLALADQRGQGCSLFNLSILSFSWSTEPASKMRTKHKQTKTANTLSWLAMPRRGEGAGAGLINSAFVHPGLLAR